MATAGHILSSFRDMVETMQPLGLFLSTRSLAAQLRTELTSCSQGPAPLQTRSASSAGLSALKQTFSLCPLYPRALHRTQHTKGSITGCQVKEFFTQNVK